MKTIFTSILCLFFLLSGYKEAFTQSGYIVPYTIKSSSLEPDTYYPMAGFTSSAYQEYSYIKDGSFMNMRLLFPGDYDSLANDDKEYPLILMLHGAGESALTNWSTGNDYPNGDPRIFNNDHQLLYGGREHLDAVRNRPPSNQRHFPGFVLFPQVMRNGSWSGSDNERVIEILEILIDSLKIDPLRIYVWGLSNGASGTWDIINRRPDLFAAALPMSGTYDVNWSNLAHMPIWLFQGEKDRNPAPGDAEGKLKRLRNEGGTPRYTLYKGVGHGTWHDAYKEPDFYTWMLQYSELSIHVFENTEFRGAQFCAGDEIKAKLGISPGHDAYEWRKVGNTDILGESHNLIVHEIGQYEVRIKRRGSDEWTEWSEPVEVKIRDPYYPELIVSYSTTKPSKDGFGGAILTYPGEFEKIYYELSTLRADGTWSSFSDANNGKRNERSRVISTVNNQRWRARIDMVNGCHSEWSDTLVTTRNAPVDMIAPSDLTAVVVSETKINLFWQDNSNDEKGFEIYRSEDNGANFVYITKTKPNESFFADKGLKANTEYIYDMRAVNFKGSSPYTGEIFATTYEDTEAPTRPGNLVATSNLDMQSVSLTWEPARDNVGVNQYRIFEVLNNNTLNLIGTTAETNFQISGLQESTLYTYVVKAIDASNNLSEASNYASVVTEVCGLRYTLYVTDETQPYGSVNDFLPEQIVGKGFVPNFNIGVRSELVTDVNDHFGFEFEGILQIHTAGQYEFELKSDDGSVLWINGVVVVNHDGSHGFTEKRASINLTAGKHFIKVRYMEISGGENLEVRYSGPGVSKTLIPNGALCIDEYSGPPAPSAPSDLVAQAVSENQINLSWTDNSSDEYGFELYRAKAAQGPFELVYTSEENITAFEDSDLAPNTTYFYKVKAISAQGPSSFSTKEGGIDYRYYEYQGSWSALPDFSELSSIRTGTTSNFGLGLGERADYFAYVFEGEISLPRDGDYIFYTSSDDGSKLYINDEMVVNNDGLHGTQERAGSVYLTAGVHPIRVEYYEGTGDAVLQARYEGSGINKQLIPNDVLNFVSATTSGDFTPPHIPPTNLQVLNKTAFSVGLSWTAATDNVGVTGYIVYSVVNGEAQDTLAITDEFGIVIANDNVATTANNLVAKPFSKASANSGMSLLGTTAISPTISTEVRGLDPETSYSVLVKAFDGAGNVSLPSNIVSFTTNVDPNNPLPIELVSFKGAAENGIVQLTWKTASEKDNDFFTIERAVNSKVFEIIGEVDGAGNSIIERDYFYEDVAPVIGTLFYRLKQTDFNGDFAYSDIIAIQYPTVSSINKQGIDNLILYPNPASSENINLKLEGDYAKTPVSLKIADMLGKVHLSYQFEADELAKGVRVDSRYKLTPGIYVVIIEQASQIRKLKLIIEE